MESIQTSIKAQFDLTGKVAIVTGASKGIGEAMAFAFAEAGASVVVSSRKQDAVDEVASGLQAQGFNATGIAAHTGSVADLQHLVSATMAKYGRIDIVVNNAAANPVFGPLTECGEDAFGKIMDVNVKGPFELGKLMQPIMAQQGGGAILNISSVGGLSPEPGLGIYSVSKAALVMLTKSMAHEWGANNIRVNAICPGLIKTKFSQAIWENEKNLNYMLRSVPLARVGTAEEVAALALFLASPAGAYCTGGVYTVDGGHTI
jgi:NAD(P)-dependent dehydrogenase (short-subunit alcohol dehydrogenase family)